MSNDVLQRGLRLLAYCKTPKAAHDLNDSIYPHLEGHNLLQWQLSISEKLADMAKERG